MAYSTHISCLSVVIFFQYFWCMLYFNLLLIHKSENKGKKEDMIEKRKAVHCLLFLHRLDYLILALMLYFYMNGTTLTCTIQKFLPKHFNSCVSKTKNNIFLYANWKALKYPVQGGTFLLWFINTENDLTSQEGS